MGTPSLVLVFFFWGGEGCLHWGWVWVSWVCGVTSVLGFKFYGCFRFVFGLVKVFVVVVWVRILSGG